MPFYNETLEPIGGGGDDNLTLMRSRDVAITSPINIASFADFGSGGKTKVTTDIDHRLEDDDIVKIITNNTFNQAFNGSYTVDDSVRTEPSAGNGYASEYTFTIVRVGGHTACDVYGVRMIGPAVSSISDTAVFSIDTAANALQSETTYATALTVKKYMFDEVTTAGDLLVASTAI